MAKESESPDSKGQARPKPMLAVEQQIAHLKEKGVKFELCSESEAADYLKHANNYLRAASYRKLYPIYLEGPHRGEYIGLNFAALKELSSADRVLRSALREICIDVEHFARLDLLNRCAAQGEDGYAVVADFLERQRARGNARMESSLKARGSTGKYPDAYSGDLISHYMDDLGGLSVWALLEVTDFGQFADLWLFCSERWGDDAMRDEHYVLKSVKGLRNACSHNSCIVNGFSSSSTLAPFPTSGPIVSSMNSLGLKNSKSRRSKLRNLRIAQIAATLYASHTFCVRPSTRRRHAEKMRQAKEALASTLPLCPADGSLAGYFDFFFKLVDLWLPMQS